MSSKKVQNKNEGQVPANGNTADVVFPIALVFISLIVLSRLVTKFFLNIDDDVYFTNNPFIKSLSLDNIKAIFTQPYGGNFHPITTLIEAFEYKFFKLNASSYHFVSLIIHLINSVLVFILAGKFFNKIEFKAIIATIFALHPMHVESVAWISDKTDLYYTFFFLLGMLSYLKYTFSGKKMLLVPTFIYYTLSILCKPSAIAFPFILIFIDYYYGKKLNKELVYKIPFFLVACIFGYITYFTLHVDTKLSIYLMPDYSLMERFFVANYTFCYYIYQFFFPLGLSALHLAPKEIPFYFYFTPVFTAAILYLVYRSLKFGREIMFGFLFYLFTIGLVLQIIPSGYTIVAERYSYLPYFGLAFILAHLISLADKKEIQLPKAISGNHKLILYIFAGFLIVLTFLRTNEWKDLESINRNIADMNPNSAYAQLSAAYIEIDAGNIEMATNYLEAAEQSGEENSELLMMKGKAYYQIQKNADALKNFQKAHIAGSKENELDKFLALSYFVNNNFDSAASYFSKVIEKDTILSAENLRNRAICNYYLENFQRAIDDYSLILTVDSTLGNVYSERGVCFQKINDLEKACADWHLAVKYGYDECKKDIEENCK